MKTCQKLIYLRSSVDVSFNFSAVIYKFCNWTDKKTFESCKYQSLNRISQSDMVAAIKYFAISHKRHKRFNFPNHCESLYSLSISSSQRLHHSHGKCIQVSSHQSYGNPIYIFLYQCTERQQAILHQFLHHSKVVVLVCFPLRSPVDDRQRHCLCQSMTNHSQYPSQMKDDVFPLFHLSCLNHSLSFPI